MTKAKVKINGKVIEGFLDGKGHFDVPVDHCEFERYDVNELEIVEIEPEPRVLTWKDVMRFRMLFDIYDAELDAGVAPYAPMCIEYYKEILRRFYEDSIRHKVSPED